MQLLHGHRPSLQSVVGPEILETSQKRCWACVFSFRGKGLAGVVNLGVRDKEMVTGSAGEEDRAQEREWGEKRGDTGPSMGGAGRSCGWWDRRRPRGGWSHRRDPQEGAASRKRSGCHDEWPPDALMPFHVFHKMADSLGPGLSFAFIWRSQHSPRGGGSGRTRITMETWKYPFLVFLKQV